MNDSQRVSRRDLLRGRLFGKRPSPDSPLDSPPGVPSDVPVSVPPSRPLSASQSPRYRKAFPVLRPPGAVEEEVFLSGCTKCEACIEACPHQSIVHAPIRFRRAAGTPLIDPIQQPCWMCADYPCIAACEPGVLRFDLPPRLGTARIDTLTCLAYQGSFCTVCSEQCPVEGAIETAAGKPRIVEDRCTGCGVCQYVCPAPHNAVLLMPLAERPSGAQEENDRADPR